MRKRRRRGEDDWAVGGVGRCCLYHSGCPFPIFCSFSPILATHPLTSIAAAAAATASAAVQLEKWRKIRKKNEKMKESRGGKGKGSGRRNQDQQ